jgi:hypothetical protein
MIIMGIILGSTSFKRLLQLITFFIVFLGLILMLIIIVLCYIGINRLNLLSNVSAKLNCHHFAL